MKQYYPTGHFVTKEGKTILATTEGKLPKVSIGLFRSPHPMPHWVVMEMDYFRFRDWVDEPITHDWYERKSLGRLHRKASGKFDIVTNPQITEATWQIDGRTQEFDGAFVVTEKDQTLLSVDIFCVPTYSGHGAKYTYAITQLYVLHM